MASQRDAELRTFVLPMQNIHNQFWNTWHWSWVWNLVLATHVWSASLSLCDVSKGKKKSGWDKKRIALCFTLKRKQPMWSKSSNAQSKLFLFLSLAPCVLASFRFANAEALAFSFADTQLIRWQLHIVGCWSKDGNGRPLCHKRANWQQRWQSSWVTHTVQQNCALQLVNHQSSWAHQPLMPCTKSDGVLMLKNSDNSAHLPMQHIVTHSKEHLRIAANPQIGALPQNFPQWHWGRQLHLLSKKSHFKCWGFEKLSEHISKAFLFHSILKKSLLKHKVQRTARIVILVAEAISSRRKVCFTCLKHLVCIESSDDWLGFPWGGSLHPGRTCVNRTWCPSDCCPAGKAKWLSAPRPQNSPIS